MFDGMLSYASLLSSFFMLAVIWLVQLLQYPAYHFVQPVRFRDFEIFHCNRISYVVIPGMLIEAASGICLLYLHLDQHFYWLNAITIAALWLCTFLVQVPIHNRLGKVGYQRDIVDQLIRTNWIRTALWSGKALLWIIYWPM